MASTVNEVLGKFLRRWPMCDRLNSERLFADAHREIVARCNLREVTVQVSLTAGTRLYDLTSEALSIRCADYRTSSTQYRSMEETSVDDLDEWSPGWRTSVVRGSPTKYFVIHKSDSDGAKMQIGFDPIPDTTTSSGYPIVDLFCIREAALTEQETVPPQLLSDEVYLSCMSEAYVLEIEALRPQHPFWHGRKKDELERNEAHVRNRLARLPTIVTLGTRGNRVV